MQFGKNIDFVSFRVSSLYFLSNDEELTFSRSWWGKSLTVKSMITSLITSNKLLGIHVLGSFTLKSLLVLSKSTPGSGAAAITEALIVSRLQLGPTCGVSSLSLWPAGSKQDPYLGYPVENFYLLSTKPSPPEGVGLVRAKKLLIFKVFPRLSFVFTGFSFETFNFSAKFFQILTWQSFS